jgi:hypothetical protein
MLCIVCLLGKFVESSLKLLVDASSFDFIRRLHRHDSGLHGALVNLHEVDLRGKRDEVIMDYALARMLGCPRSRMKLLL